MSSPNPLRHLIAAIFALAASLACAADGPALRGDVTAFIDEMSAKHAYDAQLLRKLFSEVKPRPSIVRAMSAPATARPWFEFRRRIVEPSRIEGGLRFWMEHAAVLERASREFGVPQEIIVATIGIETMYGRNTGNFRVLDALATLAFDYPPRADFFRGELEEYLLLGRDSRLDIGGMRGSYAGAIGLPQFMPSSYRKYAIDFDGDGRRDLVNSASDAIGSVANYYRSFGWTPDGAVVLPAAAGAADVPSLVAAGIRPSISIGELRSRGLLVESGVDDNAAAAVFSIETETGPQVMLGLNNFYVITRYNRSVNYAMAVYELAREIRAQMKASGVPAAEVSEDR